MSDVKGKTGAVLRETAVLTGAVANEYMPGPSLLSCEAVMVVE